jgi:hypothetical protein
LEKLGGGFYGLELSTRVGLGSSVEMDIFVDDPYKVISLS